MTLLRAREAVMRHFRAQLRHYGLTEQQWRVLRALVEIDAVEVTELARLTFLHGPSLSRILPDLEERKLISRRTADEDLRRGIISVTRKGEAMIDVIAPHSAAIYAEITTRCGKKELAEIERLLAKLEASLSVGPPICEMRNYVKRKRSRP